MIEKVIINDETISFSFCLSVKVVCNEVNLFLTLCADLHVSNDVG